MKIDVIVPDVPKDIVLTMTEDEADILKELSAFDQSLPDLLYERDHIDRPRHQQLSTFLTNLHNSLRKATNK